MANLKAIAARLKSVKNIKKITESMKMVSAAKYSKAEQELKRARPYGEGAQMFYEAVEVEAREKDQPKELLVALSSDRGLCGAIHTNICKRIKEAIGNSHDPKNVAVIIVGEKARAQLGR